MTKLIHPKLSYQVRGVLLDVYNALGPMLKERYYRDAIVVGLEKRGITCEPEKDFEVCYEGERVGLYYVDVWIEEGKILLELKVSPEIEPIHKAQALSYLKVTDADLAIVANYGSSSLNDVRLPNFLRDKQPVFEWQSKSTSEGLLYPDLVNHIQRACFRVHYILGSGFLHQVYRRATMIELRRNGLNYDYIKQMPIEYENQLLGYQDVRLILVEDKILLAVFALRMDDETLVEQIKAHLRRMSIKLGLFANFYGTELTITMVRV
ncbi:MAG: GxxExxY protein [Anaerolineales bacterium]|nr:GxxExxY protein [Anaerolineales bacterium]